MTYNDFSNHDDVIDSRDIVARLEELQDERQDWIDDWMENNEDKGEEVAKKQWENEHEEETLELGMLQEVIRQIDAYSGDGTRGGCTLIRDSYFEDYAEETARDIGAISREDQWPLNCIDWKEAAEELQQDYTSLEFDGVTYWFR